MNLSSIRTKNDFDKMYALLTSNNEHLLNQNQIYQLIYSLTKQINFKLEKNDIHLRENLIKLVTKQIFSHVKSIELQSSIMMQLTEVTKQLTSIALVNETFNCILFFIFFSDKRKLLQINVNTWLMFYIRFQKEFLSKIFACR